MPAHFQSNMTEWIGLPLSKMENLKLGNKFVRSLRVNDEFHSEHVVFETVMGHPWGDVLDIRKYGPGIQGRFRAKVTRVEVRLTPRG